MKLALAMTFYWFGSAIDWWTTVRVLRRGGREANGIVRWIIDKLPWDTDLELALLKVAVFAFLSGTGAPAWTYWVVGGAYLLAGIGNYKGWWGRIARRIARKN